jgi:hypothetical protein
MRKIIFKRCINDLCGEEFQTKDNRTKFCSLSCSAKYNNQRKEFMPEEERKQRSDRMKKYYQENPDKIRRGDAQSKSVGQGTKGKHKTPSSIADLSTRTQSKIMARLGIGCSN